MPSRHLFLVTSHSITMFKGLFTIDSIDISSGFLSSSGSEYAVLQLNNVASMVAPSDKQGLKREKNGAYLYKPQNTPSDSMSNTKNLWRLKSFNRRFRSRVSLYHKTSQPSKRGEVIDHLVQGGNAQLFPLIRCASLLLNRYE